MYEVYPHVMSVYPVEQDDVGSPRTGITDGKEISFFFFFLILFMSTL